MLSYTLPLFLLVTTAVCKPVVLEFKFDSEKPVHYEMTQTTEQIQESTGMTLNMVSTNKNHIVTELLETKEDGTIIIGNTTNMTSFEMKGAGIDLSYSADNPDDKEKLSDPTIASLVVLDGIQIQLHLDKSGSVLGVPNVDEVKDSILDMEDIDLWLVADMLTDEDAIIGMQEANFKLLPKEPVEIGERWDRKFVIPTGGFEITMNLNMSLDNVTTHEGSEIAEISFIGDVLADYGEELGEFLSLEDSKITGSAKFNIELGAFESFSMITSFNTIVNQSGGDDPDMTIAIKQTTTNTRVED